MFKQTELTLRTSGRGTINITQDIETFVREAGITTGLCHVFVRHTSASLFLCENADPDVRHDLERFMARLVRDGDPLFVHQDEGPDDMAAHVRTILTQSSLTLPVTAGRCALGVWQGVFLWEHRYAAHRRDLILTVQGE